MHGESGRGKSCASACVYLAWPRSARWYETHAIVSDILKCRTNDSGAVSRHTEYASFMETEADICRKVAECSLAVFDDVGMRKPSDAAFEVFFGLVNLRRGKPTIYTGNLGARELTTVYDKRIASRILSGTVIQVTGDDRRLEGVKFVKA